MHQPRHIHQQVSARSGAGFQPKTWRLKPLMQALFLLGLASPVCAAPEGGVVRAGDARIVEAGLQTRIEQTSQRAVIDWRSFSIGAAEQVLFLQPSASSATLNRVTGEQVSHILGRLDAIGYVFLINPNGIVFGHGAQINVGGLIASTSNISNNNFMAGRLLFETPGKSGAGVVNSGTITATEGGLIALVAPHVRNDGLLQARLGRVMLGATDTFTIDLYGDSLINLALSEAHLGQLHHVDGAPVNSLITQAGQIDAAGGQVMLISAANARNVLDSLINMSGSIKADSATQQGGRIVLSGEGGKVEVSGALSAQGVTGGAISVLGEQIHLTSIALLDASGSHGGGVIHVGGAYQGQGDTYRSRQTSVDAGAVLKSNALAQGNGGEVVVWSDGYTAFSGTIEAKGGMNGGNGGRLEVSGKGALAFLGMADASAAKGIHGSLLLDPAFLNIGLAEATQINQVLRTGTSTILAADVDIDINSQIDGRGGSAGGGIMFNAGNDINVNDFIVTNNGAINFNAGHTVHIAPGKAIFAGSGPITIITGGDFSTGQWNVPIAIPAPATPFASVAAANAYRSNYLGQFATLVTSGALTIDSTGGSVNIDAPISSQTGAVTITAFDAIHVNQKIQSNNAPITLDAGGGITIAYNDDSCGGDPMCGHAPEIDAGAGDLTLKAIGNIVNLDYPDPVHFPDQGSDAANDFVGGVATAGKLTIDTRGMIVNMRGMDTRARVNGRITPTDIVLIGDQGIDFAFRSAEAVNNLYADSINGLINLNVIAVDNEIVVNAGVNSAGTKTCINGNECSVEMEIERHMGTTTFVTASHEIQLGDTRGGAVTLEAGTDVIIRYLEAGSLTVTAGNDILFGDNKDQSIILSGPLSLTAGRHILTTVDSPIWVTTDSPATFDYGNNIALYALETTGGTVTFKKNGNLVAPPTYSIDRRAASVEMTSPTVPPGPTVGSPNLPPLAQIVPPVDPAPPPPVIADPAPPPPAVADPAPPPAVADPTPPPGGAPAPAPSDGAPPATGTALAEGTPSEPQAAATAATDLATGDELVFTNANGEMVFVFNGGRGAGQTADLGRSSAYNPPDVFAAAGRSANNVSCPPGALPGSTVIIKDGLGRRHAVVCAKG